MASLMLFWKRVNSYFTEREEPVLNDDAPVMQQEEEDRKSFIGMLIGCH
jgi:hypothetical protein